MCDVSECKTMDELFTCWKNKQSSEECDNKDSFVPDGIICEEEYGKRAPRILFVSKESNLDPASKERESTGNTDCFWLQKWVNSGKSSAETGSGTKYINVLAILCNAVLSGKKDASKKGWDVLKNCAYININKRGGHSSCDDNSLAAYANDYQKYIRKQIELIDPDVIVCCSETAYNLLTKTVGVIHNNIKWAYHPSCRRSYKTILDTLNI